MYSYSFHEQHVFFILTFLKNEDNYKFQILIKIVHTNLILAHSCLITLQIWGTAIQQNFPELAKF